MIDWHGEAQREWREATEAGTPVLGRGGLPVGALTGRTRLCQMEGCGGRRLVVRWSDGRYTYPCERGMAYHDGVWRIR